MNNRQAKSGSKKQNAHKTQSKISKGNHMITLPDTNDHSKCFGDWECRRPVVEKQLETTPMIEAFDNPQDTDVIKQMIEDAKVDIGAIPSNPQDTAVIEQMIEDAKKDLGEPILFAGPTTHPL